MTQPRILFDPKDHPDLTSGYAIIARNILPLLADRYGKDNVIILAPVFHRDHIGEWHGMTVVGAPDSGFGENWVLAHYREYGCNMLLTVGDLWPLGIIPDLAAKGDVLWVSWCPVDWIGMPKNILNRIRPAHRLVPFSKSGEQQLKKAGLTNVAPAIWLGLDTKLWKPMPRETLPRAMASLGYREDTFNLLIVGANQERKRLRQQLEAVALFNKVHPEARARLYLHTAQVGERDLRADVDELGLEQMVNWPDPYIMSNGGFPEDAMHAVFCCADVVLNVCHEGFGLAQTQAQACGVPVICFTEGAGPELVRFGIETPPLSVETSAGQMAQGVPHPIAIAAALGDLWKRRQEAGVPLRSMAAADWAQNNLSWETIARQWYQVIDDAMVYRQRYCLDMPGKGIWNLDRASRSVDIS